MATRLSFAMLAAAFVLAIIGCGDNSNPTDNGNTDTTPPTVVSSSPSNHQAGVDVNASLSLTFSEPVSQPELDPQLAPDPGSGTVTWSGDGKTATFDPDLPLADDQQYSLTIPPGGVKDLAGNGNTRLINIRFTTAGAMASGSFAGVISGDPLSNFAKDPTGGYVIAMDGPLFGSPKPLAAGTSTIAVSNTYKVDLLPDRVYFPTAIMDSNHDGTIDPPLGDAVGAYGVDIGTGDTSVDSVTIVAGADLTGVNFPLYDPSAIAGTVSYSGSYAGDFYNLYIGLFDTSNWDPSDPPVVGTMASWSNYPEWRFNTIENVLTDDTYYVGAYLDVNFNATYDSGTDPAGLYGGIPPTSVHFEKGSDVLGIVIPLEDPVATSNSPGVSWPVTPSRAPWVMELSKAIRQLQLGERK